MFDYPNDPFFPGRRRQFRSSFNTSYTSYEDSPSPSPYTSYENVRQMQLAPHSPLGLRTYSTRVSSPAPSLPLTDLPSRVHALHRRGAILSTYLMHLAAVVEPLKCAKVDEVSELDLRDVLQEGSGLHEAMQGLQEQFEEVRGMLRELTIERRDVVRKLRGDQEKGLNWKSGKGGY